MPALRKSKTHLVVYIFFSINAVNEGEPSGAEGWKPTDGESRNMQEEVRIPLASVTLLRRLSLTGMTKTERKTNETQSLPRRKVFFLSKSTPYHACQQPRLSDDKIFNQSGLDGVIFHFYGNSGFPVWWARSVGQGVLRV